MGAHSAISVLDKYLPQDSADIRVTVTYAQSIDGRISAGRGLRTKLSGPDSHAITHYLRSRHDAILVGIGTLLADDPRLSCRHPGSVEHPRPVILDTNFRWPVDAKTWQLLEGTKSGTGRAPWVLVGPSAARGPAYAARKSLVTALGGRVVELPDLKWRTVRDWLHSAGVRSVMVEGGARVIDNVLTSQLPCTVVTTIAPVFLGASGVDVAPSARVDLQDVAWAPAGSDSLVCGRLG